MTGAEAAWRVFADLPTRTISPASTITLPKASMETFPVADNDVAGRVTPCAPFGVSESWPSPISVGAHGVRRPTDEAVTRKRSFTELVTLDVSHRPWPVASASSF